MIRPNNKALLKNRNKTLVLRALQIKPGTSRHELAEITGLSFPTVSKIVQALLDEGVVCEAGVLESTGGRRPDRRDRAPL